MQPSDFTYRRAYDLPKGRRVTFALDAASEALHVDWNCPVPDGKLMRKLWPHYFAARHDFLSHATSDLGINVIVVDL